MTYILKDPQARVDHAFAWDDYGDGEIVVHSMWTISPEPPPAQQPAPPVARYQPLTIEASAFDLGTTSVTMSGGVPGHVYRLANRVTLSDGQVDERSLIIRVEDR